MTRPRRGASRAAFALVGAGAADGLQQERADAAFRIVAGHAGDAAIHDMANAVDRDAGLRDVRSDDHFAQRVRGKSEVLLLRFEFAVQRDAGHALPRFQTAQRVQRAVDFAASRHENEDVAGRTAIDDPLDLLRRLRRDGAVVGRGKIAHLHRITLPFRNKNRAFIQIRGNRLGIERGRHYDHRQIRPLRLLQMLHQCERDIAEQIALVELIENHRADIAQRAIILQPAQQNALGDKANARADARVIIKANLIPHFRAQLSLTLPSHARRHRASRHSPRLQNDDHPVARDPRIEQHLRHLRGLARTRRRDEHQPISRAQSAQDVGVDFPNW